MKRISQERYPFFYYHLVFRQKEGKQRARRVKHSRRPISMEQAAMIFVPAGSCPKLEKEPSSVGMIPVLLMVVMERPRASGISRPVKVISSVHKKMKPRYTKK